MFINMMTTGGWRDIDSPGEADFYAVIQVNGVEYREAMHEDQDSIKPQIGLTQVPISPLSQKLL